MAQGLTEIRARLRAADCALARAQGGSSELAQVREAVGSLLVAVHELAGLWEAREATPAGTEAATQAPPPAVRRRRSRT